MEISFPKGKLPIIKSARLTMRDIQLEDISDEYLAWLNDPEVTKYLEIRFARQTRDMLESYLSTMLNNIDKHNHFGIYDMQGGRLVGTITVRNIDQNHLRAKISLVLGLKEARGRGYATESLNAVLYYLFKYLGLYKIESGFYDGHFASEKVLKNNGFKVEGRRKASLLDYKNNRVDHVLLGLTADEFEANEDLLGGLPPSKTENE